MTTKIRRGPEFALYLGGTDNSLALAPIVAEEIDSEIVLNPASTSINSSISTNVSFPLGGAMNFALKIHVYVSGSTSTLTILLDNLGTGEYKDYNFMLKGGSNFIELFEPDLQADQLTLLLSDPTFEVVMNVSGVHAGDSYLGA